MRSATRRKSRKNYFRAPIHERRKQVKAPLSSELRKELKKRNSVVKKGYTVKVMRGSHKGKEGRVIRVSYMKRLIYIEGITRPNARGEDKPTPIHPSNVVITSIKG